MLGLIFTNDSFVSDMYCDTETVVKKILYPGYTVLQVLEFFYWTMVNVSAKVPKIYKNAGDKNG